MVNRYTEINSILGSKARVYYIYLMGSWASLIFKATSCSWSLELASQIFLMQLTLILAQICVQIDW